MPESDAELLRSAGGGKGLHHEDLVETEDNPLEPVYMTLSLLPFQK